MFQTFDVSTVSASSSTPIKFEHGESYPAICLGVWNASKTYNDESKNGMGLIVAIADENNNIVYRSLFINLSGYVLSSKATYCRLYQSLLRVGDTDSALQEKIKASGLGDFRALVGRPCLALMKVKETKDGKPWSSLEMISGETARSKGLSVDVATLPPIDVRKVFGKFIEIKNLDDCVIMDGVKTVDPLSVDDGIEFVTKEKDVEAALF